jgi:hypothetical protein
VRRCVDEIEAPVGDAILEAEEDADCKGLAQLEEEVRAKDPRDL